MSKRTFILQGEDLHDTVRNMNLLHSGICMDDIHGGSFIEYCYEQAMKHPRDMIEKLFFEKTTTKTIDEFAEVTELCTLYRFKEVYHKIGKYGVKNFITTIKNGIVLK